MEEEIRKNNIWFGLVERSAVIKKFLRYANEGLTPQTLWLADDEYKRCCEEAPLVYSSRNANAKPEELIVDGSYCIKTR
jgi:hypothetical protein